MEDLNSEETAKAEDFREFLLSIPIERRTDIISRVGICVFCGEDEEKMEGGFCTCLKGLK